MISLENYVGREQAYVKHVFLASYLESLIHKTASTFNQIAYIDGFAGPWQSAGENYEDTSFGIALRAMRNAKASWKRINGRDVQMLAFLVEQDATAYAKLEAFAAKFPDITIKTYNQDFTTASASITKDIPAAAFAFFFIDPKGWGIKIQSIETMLSRPKSEVVFNFMFDFINRAASMSDPKIVSGLDELILTGNWRQRLSEIDSSGFDVASVRQEILVSGFRETLQKIGNYTFVAETTVLRPLRDRPLYCLMYATRHPKGIEVFRDCQIEALRQQSAVRAGIKLQNEKNQSGQTELFASLHEMGPDQTESCLEQERAAALQTLLSNIPQAPSFGTYGDARAAALTNHVVRVADVNRLAATLRKEGRLLFADWPARKQVPEPEYQVQRVGGGLLDF